MRIAARFDLYVGLESDTRPPVSEDELRAVLDRHLTGYTLTRALGLWRGRSEASAIVSILAPAADVPAVLESATAAARDITRELGQSEVWLARTAVALTVVSADSKGGPA